MSRSLKTRRSITVPLTPLQRAYVAGRHTGYPWGGLAAHDHRAYRGPLDVDRLRAAWAAVLSRHDLLRAVIDPERGFMRLLDRAPADGIVVHDLRGRDPDVARRLADAVAARLSHELRPLDEWPLVGLEVCLLPGSGADQAHELHFSIDQTVLDHSSLWIVLDELTAEYEAPGSVAELPDVAFVTHEKVRAEREAERRDTTPKAPRDTASDAGLPPGPPLPARWDVPARIDISHTWLTGPDWARVKKGFGRTGEAAVVFAVLAQVLGAWRGATRFTVSMPRSQRLPFHADVARLVGPLSTFSLLPFDLRAGVGGDGGSLRDVARATQRHIWSILSAPELDGMAQLADLTARGRRADSAAGGEPSVASPVVFTSLLGFGDPNRPVLGGMTPTAVHSQNAQVALDIRIDQPGGDLHLAWHERAGVFDDGEVLAVAAVTERVLAALADGELAVDEPGLALRGLLTELITELVTEP